MATVKFRIRRDTAANWASANPILALGEPGLETDTRRTKYGDGVTAWSALSYSGPAHDQGDYTPTLTAIDNVASATVTEAHYSRNGNMVVVDARITVTPTAASTRVNLNIALPIASNFTGGGQCNGTAGAISGSPNVVAAGLIFSDAANDAARLAFVPPNTSVQTITLIFQYKIIP